MAEFLSTNHSGSPVAAAASVQWEIKARREMWNDLLGSGWFMFPANWTSPSPSSRTKPRACHQSFTLSRAARCGLIFVPSRGRLPKWPTGADCKSAVYDFDGSNPSPTTISFAIVFVNARGLVERGTQIDRAVISPQNNSSKARGQPSARFNRHDVIH